MPCFIFIAMLFLSAPAWAEEVKPLRVKELIERENLSDINNGVSNPAVGATLYMGKARPYKTFQVKGIVDQVFRCPPCPPDVVCKPCSDFIVLSDTAGACPELKTPQSCPGSLQLLIDHANNYTNITPGTEMTVEIETSMSLWVKGSVTPEQKEQSATLQRTLKETLDKQPGLQPAARPEWLKDVPGETYRIKP